MMLVWDTTEDEVDARLIFLCEQCEELSRHISLFHLSDRFHLPEVAQFFYSRESGKCLNKNRKRSREITFGIQIEFLLNFIQRVVFWEESSEAFLMTSMTHCISPSVDHKSRLEPLKFFVSPSIEKNQSKEKKTWRSAEFFTIDNFPLKKDGKVIWVSREFSIAGIDKSSLDDLIKLSMTEKIFLFD